MSEWFSQIQRAFSTKKQSAWGTALVNGSMTEAFPFKGEAVAVPGVALIGDDEETGRGHEWPTDSVVARLESSLNLSYDLSTEAAAYLLTFAMGACSSAQQGESAAYKHDITLLAPATADQLPYTTIVEMLTSGIKKKYSDMVVDSVRISGEYGNPRLSVEAEMVGSGKEATSDLSMPSLTTMHYLPWGGVSVKYGTRDSEAEVKTRLTQFDFAIRNNHLRDLGYQAGGGTERAQLLFGKREFDFSFTLLADNSTTIRDAWRAGTEASVLIEITGALIADTYYHKLYIDIPNFIITGLEHVKVETRNAWRITGKLHYHSGTSKILSAYVINTETAYLGAEA